MLQVRRQPRKSPDLIPINQIRRLARRGGVRRVSGHTYKQVKSVFQNFIIVVLTEALRFTSSRHGYMVNTNDIIRALDLLGNTLYGFEGHESLLAH